MLEKGMGDLLGDVIENKDLKLQLVPVLKEIVNELRSSQTGTAMDLSTREASEATKSWLSCRFARFARHFLPPPWLKPFAVLSLKAS